MNSKKTRSTLRYWLLLFSFGFLLYLFWVFIGKFAYHEFVTQDDWKKKTIPLSNEARLELCEKFSLTENELCSKNNIVYGPDFYRYITDYFEGDANLHFSRQDIDTKLGEFLLYCQPYGNDFVACYYDLAGDNVFRIIAFFTKEGTLYNLSASVH